MFPFVTLSFFWGGGLTSRGLILPTKEKKQGRRARLLRKFRRHKAENASSKPQHGLVGLLETMRVQMEVIETLDTHNMFSELTASLVMQIDVFNICLAALLFDIIVSL